MEGTAQTESPELTEGDFATGASLNLTIGQQLEAQAIAAVVNWTGVVDDRHMPVEFNKAAMQELAANPFARAAIRKAFDKAILATR